MIYADRGTISLLLRIAGLLMLALTTYFTVASNPYFFMPHAAQHLTLV